MLLSFNLLNQFSDLTHFCTTRIGGFSQGNYASFNLSPYSGDNPEHFIANKLQLCKEIDVKAQNLIIPYQNHGTEILEIDDVFLQSDELLQQKMLYGVDALFTKKKNICIGVTTADCVPLIFYDIEKEIIAVAHAGWRGTCNRIAEKLISSLVEQYQSNPESIFVVIGPSISAEVYEVGEDLISKFEENKFPTSLIFKHINRKTYLDLWQANQYLLEQSGTPASQIEIAGLCTYTQHERFFSARRLGIKSGRMLTGIMMKTAHEIKL